MTTLKNCPDRDREKKFENWSIFDEDIIRRTKCAQFFGGHPVYFLIREIFHRESQTLAHSVISTTNGS